MCFKMPEMPTIPKVETRATDLLPSWEGVSPEAPVYGGRTNSTASTRKGKAALKIDPIETDSKKVGTSSPYFTT